jgi:hypothetical protein
MTYQPACSLCREHGEKQMLLNVPANQWLGEFDALGRPARRYRRVRICMRCADAIVWAFALLPPEAEEVPA